MSGLLQELGKTSLALEANRVSTEIKGRNIANAANPNYARQEVLVESLGNYQGANGLSSFGVGVSDVYNARNAILDDNIVRETASLGSLEGQRFYAKNTEAYFSAEVGNLADNDDMPAAGGLSKSLDTFFGSFISLAANPGESTQEILVYNSGEILAKNLNELDVRLTEIDVDIVGDSTTSASYTSELLDKVANFNRSISEFEINTTQKALNDRDLRQATIEELALYIDFRLEESTATPGSLNVIVKDNLNNDVTLVDRHYVQRNIVFNGTDYTTDEAIPTTLKFTGGRLHGVKKIRDETLTDIRGRLDDLANQLVVSVNSKYNPTSATGDFFDPAKLTAATISLDSSLSISTLKSTDTSNAGANELAVAVAELKDYAFSTGSGDVIDGSIMSHTVETVITIGQEVKLIEQKIENRSLIQNILKDRRSTEMGVSIDEEVADLLVIQKSLQANATYFRIVSELLDEIVNLVR